MTSTGKTKPRVRSVARPPPPRSGGAWVALVPAVAVGGALGSALRLGLLTALTGRAALATWTANLAGCFVLGLVVGLRERVALDERVQVLAGPGFCGGLTTVSGFASQTSILAREGDLTTAAFYVLASVLAGLGGGILGGIAARYVVPTPTEEP